MIFYQSSIKVLSKFYLTIITIIICLECPSEVCESWIQCDCTSMISLYTCSNTDDGHSRSCSIIPIFTELELVGFILYLAVQRLKDNGHLHHVLTGSPFDVTLYFECLFRPKPLLHTAILSGSIIQVKRICGNTIDSKTKISNNHTWSSFVSNRQGFKNRLI